MLNHGQSGASASGAEGCRFEPYRAYHKTKHLGGQGTDGGHGRQSRGKRLAGILAFALLAAPAAADQPAEQLARFHCAAKLSAPGGAAVWLPCLSEDLPTPGFANRWHYVLGPAAVQLLHNYGSGQLYYARVCGAAVEGGMWMAAEGHWRLDMVPAAPDVARAFTKLDGASECRWQWFQIKPLPEGYVEVLIEEPQP